MANDITHADFMQKYEAELATKKQAAKEFLLATLKLQTEYQYLVIYFDGNGDSGQTESMFLSNEDASLDARYDGDMEGDNELPEILTSARYDKNGTIEDAAWTLAPDGFESGEGGFGAVIIDATEGTVKVNYSYRIEDSVESDYEV